MMWQHKIHQFDFLELLPNNFPPQLVQQFKFHFLMKSKEKRKNGNTCKLAGGMLLLPHFSQDAKATPDSLPCFLPQLTLSLS